MKRITDEQRVESYFRLADEMGARGTLRVAAAILDVRFPPAEKAKRKSQTKKGPAVSNAAAV